MVRRHDRLIEIRDLVARLGGVEHLIERNAVHVTVALSLVMTSCSGIVDHLLHHVDLAADAIEIRER